MVVKNLILLVIVIAVLVSSGCTNTLNSKETIENSNQLQLNENPTLIETFHNEDDYVAILNQNTTNPPECLHASLLLQRASYNQTTRELKLAFFNNGENPLTGFRIKITNLNETITLITYGEFFIWKNEIRVIKLKNYENIKKVSIQSLQCKNAQDYFEKQYITGLS
jgi:hypothetical protein